MKYCKNCGKRLKPAGKNKVIGKNRKYCGRKECQAKRISLWHKKRKKNPEVIEKIRINQKKYLKSKKGKEYQKNYMKKYSAKYKRERSKRDKEFKEICNLRASFARYVGRALKGKIRKAEFYGIDFKKIINFIGKCPGKREDYHIDHIKPLRTFDLKNPEEIKKAFAPENHQWLTKFENQSKGGRYGN